MTGFTDQLKKRYYDQPLFFIMAAAVIVRLLAAIFSKGFGMHDDHFLIVEPAQAWVDGFNYMHWFPEGNEKIVPDGHSILFSGLHYLLFLFFKCIGLNDPQLKMLFVRILLAAVSLLTVQYSYKITKLISGVKEASIVGWLTALFWFMPFLSVRDLVEVFCIPFLLIPMYLMLTAYNKKKPLLQFLYAGLLLGVAFSIRFQTASFIGGVGLVLLIQRKWLPTVILGAGVLLSVLPVQGLVDYSIFGYPFAEFIEYIRYNIAAAHDYIIGPWYNYILLLTGLLIPPISLLLLFGFFGNWRKQLLLFLPSFIFLLFHSIFPNKQERFIFPIIPFVIILGIDGWYRFMRGSKYWIDRPRIMRNLWIFFAVVNFILLAPVTLSYSKKSRVEAMTYLSKYKNIQVIVLEDKFHRSAKMVPRFYLGQWVKVGSVTSDSSWQSKGSWVDPGSSDSLKNAHFVLFSEEKDLLLRVGDAQKVIPGLTYETTIKPGLVDIIMHALNPVNLNQTIVIYRNTALVPQSIK